MSLADSLERALALENDLVHEIKQVRRYVMVRPKNSKQAQEMATYGMKMLGQLEKVRAVIQQIDDEMVRDFDEDTT